MAGEKQREQVRAAAELLERGVAEIIESGKLADYFEVMGRFHNYSARNCMLIMTQRQRTSQATRGGRKSSTDRCARARRPSASWHR